MREASCTDGFLPSGFLTSCLLSTSYFCVFTAIPIVAGPAIRSKYRSSLPQFPVKKTRPPTRKIHKNIVPTYLYNIAKNFFKTKKYVNIYNAPRFKTKSS